MTKVLVSWLRELALSVLAVLLLVPGLSAETVSTTPRALLAGELICEFELDDTHPVSSAVVSVAVVIDDSTLDTVAALPVRYQVGSGSYPDRVGLDEAWRGRAYLSASRRSLRIDVTRLVRGVRSPRVWVAIVADDAAIGNSITFGSAAKLNYVEVPIREVSDLSKMGSSPEESGARLNLAQRKRSSVRQVQVLAHPNPFNPRSTFELELERQGSVEIQIYTSAGRRVWSRALGVLKPGPHQFVWNGTDDHGLRLASGVYHAVIGGEGWRRTLKLALIR